MGLGDRISELETAELVAIGLAVALVGLVVLVALTVVLAAVIGTFVLGVGEETGGDVEPTVQAGVSVAGDEDASEATVTWTSNQNAEVLVVEWTSEGGGVSVAAADEDATEGDGRARLTTVGTSLTLAADDPGTPTTVEVTVTAVNGDVETVIAIREVTI